MLSCQKRKVIEMKEKKTANRAVSKGKDLKKLLSMLFGVVIGIVLGFVLVAGMPDDAGFGTQMVLMGGMLLVFYLSMVVQIIIHEAGHMVFGLLSGYRFLSFRVFSLMWVKQDGRIRLKRLSLTGTAGQCLMAPPERSDGQMPVVLYNLGGVLMNLISCPLFVGLYFVTPAVPVLRFFWALCAASGVLTALVNGIPFSGGMVNNDGRNALSLTKNPAAMYAFYVQLKVSELTANGMRLKDMPAEWFTVPDDQEMQDGMTAAQGVYCCNRLLDEGNFEAAKGQLDHLLTMDSGIIELHRRLLICDRIYLALTLEQDPAGAAGLLDKQQQKFMKSMAQFPSVLRTEYTYQLLGRRDVGAAERVMGRFEKMVKRYPYPSEIQSERELMEQALRLSQEGQTAEDNGKSGAEPIKCDGETENCR